MFLRKFRHKTKYSPCGVNLSTVVYCIILIMILIFMFSNLLPFICFVQIWSQIWCSSNYLKWGTLLYTDFDFGTYFNNFFFYSVFGLLSSQNLKFFKSSKLSAWVHCSMQITILIFLFPKFLTFKLFWTNLVSKSNII